MSPQPDTPSEFVHLVEVYHRYGIHDRKEDFWAWERVQDIIRGADAQQAFALVVALVRSAGDDRLEHVGAGPVEDLVQQHSAALIDELETEARRDPRFREALGSIWLVAEDISPPILARLQEVSGGTILVATQAELDEVAREYDRKHFDRDA